MSKAMHETGQPPITKYLSQKVSSVLNENFWCKTKNAYWHFLCLILGLWIFMEPYKPCVHLSTYASAQSICCLLSVCLLLYLPSYLCIYLLWLSPGSYTKKIWILSQNYIPNLMSHFQKELFSNNEAFTCCICSYPWLLISTMGSELPHLSCSQFSKASGEQYLCWKLWY